MRQTTEVLIPISDVPSETAELVTAEGKLNCGACTTCGAQSFPRAEICPTCLSVDIDAVAVPGAGSLYSFSTIFVSTTFETPYTVGYVDLEGGLRVFGRILVPVDKLSCDLLVHAAQAENSPSGWGFITHTEHEEAEQKEGAR